MRESLINNCMQSYQPIVWDWPCPWAPGQGCWSPIQWRQSGVALELNANQRVTSKRAAKRMRRTLKSALGDAHVSSVTFTCEDGRPLPDTTAAEFAAHEGKMIICHSGHSPLQQLQQQLHALETGMVHLKQGMVVCVTVVKGTARAHTTPVPNGPGFTGS